MTSLSVLYTYNVFSIQLEIYVQVKTTPSKCTQCNNVMSILKAASYASMLAINHFQMELTTFLGYQMRASISLKTLM